jgi:hypothetical protein
MGMDGRIPAAVRGTTTLPAREQKRRKAMAEEKKVSREGVDINLPTTYEGRCASGKFTVLRSTFGQQTKLPEGCKFPKFEIRLPLPSNDEEAKAMYNLTLNEIIEKGVIQLGYGIDGGIKKVLFKGIDDPITMDDRALVTDEMHLAAQAAADAWRYEPASRTGARTIKASEIEAQMLELGLISEEEVGKLKADELRARMFAALSKGRKPKK